MLRLLMSSVLILMFISSTTFAVAKSDTIVVASYNLENLFDATHDPGTKDWAYLPLSAPGKLAGCQTVSERYRQRCLDTDWTEDRMRLKVQQMKRALQGAPTMPDIIGVQEVENIHILGRFARAVGYERFILEEGPDHRGIDVGLLYKTNNLIYLAHTSHRITGDDFSDKPTRDILAVFFRPKRGPNDRVLAVYVNHWPSQGNPSAKRVLVAQQLKEFIRRDKNRFRGKQFHSVVLGDFNTIAADFPHPFHTVLYTNNRSEKLADVRDVRTANLELLGKNAARVIEPLGSYFYPRKMRWQHLDRIFVSRNLYNNSGMEVLPNTLRIHDHQFLTKTYRFDRQDLPHAGSQITGVPKRYSSNANTPGEAGFSDHYMVSVKIRL